MEQYLTNDRQIAYRRAKMDYVDPDENTLRFAYEDGRHDKMSYELKYKDDVLKLKVLEEINEDFRDMTKVIKAINTSDVIHVLIKHLENSVNKIRGLSSQTFIEICSCWRGRELIIENDYIKNISKLVDDDVAAIRWNCYKSLYQLSEHVDGNQAVLKNGILEILVDKLIEEKEEDILYLILQLLKRLLDGEGAIPRLLKTQGISRLTDLLLRTNDGIREYAALNLAAISFPEDGKAAVQELECVIPLCKLLGDKCALVREATTLALCSLAQLKATKVEIIDNDYFPQIMGMLSEKIENILVNVIELIAYLAEEPRGRIAAHEVLAKLRELRENPEYEFLQSYIDETIWVIEWKP